LSACRFVDEKRPNRSSAVLQAASSARRCGSPLQLLNRYGRRPLTIDTPESRRKARLDAMLLPLPGVSARTINGLDAYFAADKMFACICGKGVGLRLPVAAATELQFSRDDVVPFQPGGMASTREWIQIDRADAADYEKDLPLFEASVAFVKAGRTR
jgi:hypothetical protein